jgi:two-component system chemotaxis response regulator CheY
MFDPKTKVLVVDDMLTMRKVVGKSLKEMGFTDITEAKDGADAWSKVNGAPEPFGLIVSDWNMPNSSGLDLLKRVRSDSRYSKLPFLLVTAESDKAQIVEALKAGVSNYVIKPFTTDILRQKIEEAHKRLLSAA